jgi:hypothetical protein
MSDGTKIVVKIFIVVIVAWLLIVTLSGFVVNLWNDSDMTSDTHPTQSTLRWTAVIIMSLSFLLPITAAVMAFKKAKGGGGK